MAIETITQQKATSRGEVWRMFDRIAPRYDLLNRLLSFRRDVAWRRRLVACLPERPDQRVLDIATGTGDVLLALYRASNRIRSGVGLDMAPKMLQLGRQKLARAGLNGVFEMVRGDATRLAIADNTFDVATIAFGIRNVTDVVEAFREMRRVLKPGGRLLVLEFSLPQNRLIRAVYVFYLRHILPGIGAVISGDAHAYHYLNQTVEEFPCGRAFNVLMSAAGFGEVSACPLSFGIATIYQGDKKVMSSE